MSIREREEKLRAIDVAKELFNAFATRTQAYKLHHAFGLTLFNGCVNRKLALTKNVEDFEVIFSNDKCVLLFPEKIVRCGTTWRNGHTESYY